MATSMQADSGGIGKSGTFLPETLKTAIFGFSSEKHIELFRQAIEHAAAAASRPGWARSAADLMAWRCSFGSPTETAMEPFPITPVSVTIKVLEDWKREGEPGYLLSRMEDSSEMTHGKRIAQRIRALRQMVREDDDGDIALDSLRSFYDFLSLHPEVGYPEITLTPDGNIYACWKSRDRALFSIHFLPQSRVRYVVFAPDRKRPHLMDRISGTSSVDTVLETADRAYGVTGWVRE